MTTFQYTLTLDDNDMGAITHAIDFYMAECIKQTEAGAGAPYWSHLSSLKEIRERRYENARQTSGNTFGRSQSSAEFNDRVQYDKNGHLVDK